MSVLLDKYPEVELLSYGNSIFNLLTNLHTVFSAAASFYIPTSSAQGFQCFHVFANTRLSFLIIAMIRGWGVQTHFFVQMHFKHPGIEINCRLSLRERGTKKTRGQIPCPFLPGSCGRHWLFPCSAILGLLVSVNWVHDHPFAVGAALSIYSQHLAKGQRQVPQVALA